MRSLQRIFVVRGVVGVAIVLLMGAPQSWAQSPTPSIPTPRVPQWELPRFIPSQPFENTQITRGEVGLDGHKLFTIGLPAVQNSQRNVASPIVARTQGIETNLNRIVERGFDKERRFETNQLRVSSAIDPQSNLPVISANDQYIMTVTTLDAQLQGLEPQSYAEQLTRIIQEALIRARQERQTDSLIHQGFVAAGILFAMLVSSWALAQWQRRLKVQQDQTQAEIPADPTVSPNTAQGASLNTRLTVHQQLVKRQQRNLKEAQRRFIQLMQVVIWDVGVFIILGLFPYTRSLQPIVFSAPLKILGIIAATYLVIRLGDVLIDRFFGALEDGEFITPEASQRLALRISTFSRVVKSLLTIILLSFGVLMILSAAGIQVLPLVAGAGIIGLGISLASQNVIKDVINGFLILLEDQYAVGDVIQIGNVSGLVEYMNLRITQLRNAEGRLITIPNSAITIVENLSKDWSRVDLAIVISYDANLDRAIHLIEQVGQEMSHDRAWYDKILEPPEVLGVDDLNNTGATVRVWIKTQPLQQWKVGREFRRRLKTALDEQGIAIGVPLQAFSVRGNLDEKAFEDDNGKRDLEKGRLSDRADSHNQKL